MPWSGSAPNQTFVRSTGTQSGATAWQLEDAAGTRVVAAKFDTHDQDIADGLSAALKRDGGNKATANIPMGGFKFTGAADATTIDDFLAAGQAGKSTANWYGNTSGTDTYTLPSMAFAPAAYTNGQVIRCRFANANTVTTPTLNQDSKGAKTIVRADGTALAVGEIAAGMVATLVYGSTDDKLFLQNTAAGVRVGVANTFTAAQNFNGAITANETITLNDDIVTPVVTLTDAATIAWDMSTGTVFKVTLGGNRALDAPTGETEGQRGELYVIQDGTGNRTLTFDASYKFPNSVTEIPDKTAGSTTKYVYYVRGANDVVIKKVWTSASNSVGFYKEYDKGSFVQSSDVTQAHGLGRYPSLIQAYIQCTSSDAGYAVGDRLDVNSICDGSTGGRAPSLYMNTTNVILRTGQGTPIVIVGSYAGDLIDITKWKIILRVYE